MKFIWALLLLAAVCLADDDNDCGSGCTWAVEGGKLTLTADGSSSWTYGYCGRLPPWWSQRDSITSVEATGFGQIDGCTFRGLTKVTTATIGARDVDDRVFEGCTSLQTVTLTEDCQTLENQVFKGCTALTTVTISEGLKYIYNNVFEGCTALTSITLPTSVYQIYDDAFALSSLTSITVTAGSDYFSSSEDGVLFDKDKEELVRYPPAKVPTTADKSYPVPDGVKTINSGAFNGCAIEVLTIGKDVYTIDEHALRGMNSLKSITVADGNTYFKAVDGVLFSDSESYLYRFPPAKQIEGNAYKVEKATTIRPHAFEGCSSLVSISFPNDLYNVYDTSFDGCTGLTKFEVRAAEPDNSKFVVGADVALVEKTGETATLWKYPAKKADFSAFPTTVAIDVIQKRAFEGSVITTIPVPIPASVKNIQAQAFKDSALTSITIPATVTTLDEHAFDGCLQMTAFEVADGSAAGFAAVDGVLFHGTTLVKYPTKKAGTEYTVASVKEDETTNEIEALAFEGVSALTTVNLEEVSNVKEGAFTDCASLARVSSKLTSPSTSGDVDAFVGCSANLNRICVSESFLESSYVKDGFCGLVGDGCAPEPPAPTPKSSSAAAVVPTLFAVVAAVLAIFF